MDEEKQVKVPTKITFTSQREIDERNRAKRAQILRVLEELRAAEQEVAASSVRYIYR